jgi:hypothetical protein
MTDRQFWGFFLPYKHPIPPLVHAGARVHPFFEFVFPTGIRRLIIFEPFSPFHMKSGTKEE